MIIGMSLELACLQHQTRQLIKTFIRPTFLKHASIDWITCTKDFCNELRYRSTPSRSSVPRPSIQLQQKLCCCGWWLVLRQASRRDPRHLLVELWMVIRDSSLVWFPHVTVTEGCCLAVLNVHKDSRHGCSTSFLIARDFDKPAYNCVAAKRQPVMMLSGFSGELKHANIILPMTLSCSTWINSSLFWVMIWLQHTGTCTSGSSW